VKRTYLLLLLPAMALTGCVSASTVPPSLSDAAVIDVLRRARNLHWLVRAHGDSIYEGRVTFVHPDAARIGRQLVPFDRITKIERSSDSGSGKATGLAVGLGIGLAAAALASAFASGMGQSVGPGVLGIIGLLAVAGAISGSAADRPDRDWVTMWEK
jgi:hypothetical protein